jgi:hypothetical protein
LAILLAFIGKVKQLCSIWEREVAFFDTGDSYFYLSGAEIRRLQMIFLSGSILFLWVFVLKPCKRILGVELKVFGVHLSNG